MLDWLTEGQAGPWHADVTTGHKLHADTWVKKAIDLDINASNVRVNAQEQPCLSKLGRYAAAHAVSHALAAGDFASAGRMCTSLGFVRACVEANEVARLVRGAMRTERALQGEGGEGLLLGLVRQTVGWLRWEGWWWT